MQIPTFFIILFIVIYLVAGSYAAYTSWRHNSMFGWNAGYKALFSVYSFIFPGGFFQNYIINGLDMETLNNRISKK